MRNTDRDFFGKQDGEKILYVVRPHPLAISMSVVKVYIISLAVFLAFTILGTELLDIRIFIFLGLLTSITIAVIGTKVINDYKKRDIAYVTDRRLVRFEPTTLFATNPRTITWDEVVKVKTYPSNVILKQLAIGNLVIHSRSSMRDYQPEEKKFYDISVDDIELKDVYYYKDLGNYIDKILFVYKKHPKEMDEIRPFITKPKGQRY